MSTVVLYCWCHSDSASVLLYFTLVILLYYALFSWLERNLSFFTNQGRTASGSTGPSAAHEGSFYKYIETSHPRTDGDKAILKSGSLPASMNIYYSKEV